MQKINDSNFENLVLGNKKSVIVYFSAVWCGPCKQVEPLLIQAEKEYPNIDFYKVDVNESKEMVAENSIKSIPTIILFLDGEEIARKIGIKSKADLIELLAK